MRPKTTSPQEMERFLMRRGFFLARKGKGAHRVYRDSSGNQTSISFHPGPIPTGTLRKIIQQCGMTVDQFNEMI